MSTRSYRRLVVAVTCLLASAVVLSARQGKDVPQEPNWPREAERPDAPKPKAAPASLLPMLGEYEGPARADGSTPKLILLEQDGALMMTLDRGPVTAPGKMGVASGADRTLAMVMIDGVRYRRLQVGPAAGGQLKVVPIRPVADVLNESRQVTPPVETGDFLPADLVELVALDRTIRLDIRYATTNNFLGSVFYSQARAFLQRPAADAVLRAQQKLKPLGYGLLIHDGYRPWYVTRTFWECTPLEKKWLVANPASGSKHNRGAAIDLTLYDLKTGAVIEMPSTYDESTSRAFLEPGPRYIRSVIVAILPACALLNASTSAINLSNAIFAVAISRLRSPNTSTAAAVGP